MTDCYKTEREVLTEAREKANKYDALISRINKGIKKHRTLAEGTKNEDYELAHNMVADCLEELKEQMEV